MFNKTPEHTSLAVSLCQTELTTVAFDVQQRPITGSCFSISVGRIRSVHCRSHLATVDISHTKASPTTVDNVHIIIDVTASVYPFVGEAVTL